MTTLKDWIKQQEAGGRTSFTLSEVKEKFIQLTDENIKRTLTRLTSKHLISSVWKGFYIIIPVEYQSRGIIPEEYYIDFLMKFLGKDYYVSLLNAAAYYGAAHQRPMQFSVMTTAPSLRTSVKKNNKINFNLKPAILPQFVVEQKMPTSYIKVSSQELTAADLITFQKEIGGLNRACTVLYELMETVKLGKLDKSFFDYVPTSTIQRLGYLLENELEQAKQANILFSKAKTYGCKFQKIPLKYNKPTDNCEYNAKWKIIVNESIEIDEM
jgi:predicted transcriptional regulator of viral defense system